LIIVEHRALVMTPSKHYLLKLLDRKIYWFRQWVK